MLINLEPLEISIAFANCARRVAVTLRGRKNPGNLAVEFKSATLLLKTNSALSLLPNLVSSPTSFTCNSIIAAVSWPVR